MKRAERAVRCLLLEGQAEMCPEPHLGETRAEKSLDRGCERSGAEADEPGGDLRVEQSGRQATARG